MAKPTMIEVTEKAGMQYRAASMQLRQEEDGNRTVELVFSTEESEVERWFGLERLGHKNGEVNMTRLSSGSAPLLMDHDFRDQIGVIESATIDGDVGRAVVRFGNSERANEIFNDVKDGIRMNVSVGYFVNRVLLEEATEDGKPDHYRVVDWEPYEISIVSVPADIQAGIGREQAVQRDIVFVKPNLQTNQERGLSMTTPNNEHTNNGNPPALPNDAARAANPPTTVSVDSAVNDALTTERTRISSINNIAARFAERLPEVQKMANKFINEGKEVRDFQEQILIEIEKSDQRSIEVTDHNQPLGMTDKEAQRFSIFKALRAAYFEDWTDASFEERCIKEVRSKADKAGVKLRGNVFVPSDVLIAPMTSIQRDMAVASQRNAMAGVAGNAAELVGTVHDAANFIDLLRNRLLIYQLGATVLSGLVGNLTIPKLLDGLEGFWVAEGQAVPQSEITTGNIALTPKTVGALAAYSRQLMLQSSPDIESLVRMELLKRIPEAIDKAAISGSGAGAEPTGVLNTTGVASLTYPNGGAPSWDDLVDTKQSLAADNVEKANAAWLMDSNLAGTLQKTPIEAGTTSDKLWSLDSDRVCGHTAYETQQMPANTILFGKFSDIFIGEWGGLDMLINPYSRQAEADIIVSVHQSVDVQVRYSQSFAILQEA